MKKINENTKFTLTIGQLKRLVKEDFDTLIFHRMEDPRVDPPDDDGDYEKGPRDWYDLSNEEQYEVEKWVAEDLMEDVGKKISAAFPGVELVEDGDFETGGLFVDDVKALSPKGFCESSVSILLKFPGASGFVAPCASGIHVSDSCDLLFDIRNEPKLLWVNGNNPDPNARWAIVKTKAGPVSEPECYKKCVKILEDAGYDIGDLESKIGGILKEVFSDNYVQSCYWEWDNDMVNENDHKWNSDIEKIVSNFQPKVHDIEGVSLTEFGTEDPVKLAEKIYAALAEKNGLTGKRYVSGGYSHAGFDYDNSFDGDFKLYFNDRPTFTFRHVVLNKRHTRWVPDGNPYDGVSPETVWITMANHCAITVKPGFKMSDLKDIQTGMKSVNQFVGKFDVTQNAKYPFQTLKWLFNAKTSWYDEKLFSNYLNFVAYEAGPFLTKKLLELGTIAGTDLAGLTAQIVNLKGVDKALEPKRGGHGQTPDEFVAARNAHRQELKRKLADKKTAAATQAKVDEFKKLIDNGITYEELKNRDDFPNIVTAVLTMSGKLRSRYKPSCCDYHEYNFGVDKNDLELYSNQSFDEDGYWEKFDEIMDDEIEACMAEGAGDAVEYDSFEEEMLSAVQTAERVIDPYDYVSEYSDDYYDSY